jgi:FkbM family methyltransferase
MIVLDRIRSWRKRLSILTIVSRVRLLLYRILPGIAPDVIKVVLRHGATTVRLRWRTSDIDVLDQVFVDREYDLPYTFSTPSVVVDAGANIGLTSLFFAERYPSATIVAIEPDLANFTLLEANVASQPNVVPICAALWHEHAGVTLEDPGLGPWGIRARPSEPGEIEVATVTMEELCDRYGNIDLLKIDIEGAERNVLAESSAWIGRVESIAIELHPGVHSDVEAVFDSVMQSFPLRFARGEITLAARGDPNG